MTELSLVRTYLAGLQKAKDERERPCVEATRWLSAYEAKNPSATLEEVWDALLGLAKDPDAGKVPPGTHLGRSWISWLARFVIGVECSDGVFSGMAKVHPGTSADRLDRGECLRLLRERLYARSSTPAGGPTVAPV